MFIRNAFLNALACASLVVAQTAAACTGISLHAADDGVVVARTVEWSLSDAQHNRIAIFPRGKAFVAQTPEGLNGKQWQGRYGFVSMTAYGQDFGPDGMNEQGLYVGMYYLPGYASYAQHDPAQSARAVSVGDYMQWMLSSFSTVDEVRAHLDEVRVVNVEDSRFGGAALPFHWKVSDPSGASIVIELVNGGEVKVYDAALGVITNAPTYDWHLTNLRNYTQLQAAPRAGTPVNGKTLMPLGAGSGLQGMPGDFTPPSRFVRAAALTASARPLATSQDAVFEAFRILDNFNIPLGATLAPGQLPTDIESGTQITSASDLKNKVYYFHTQFNRQVRMIDLKKIDFATVRQQVIDDDSGRHHEVREVRVAS